MNTIIEQILEMGKIDVTNIDNRGQIQEELENIGIQTYIDFSDRDYLVVVDEVNSEY